MELSTSIVGADVWISVSGRVDAVETPTLTERIDEQLAEEVSRLVLDLQDVDYLDSSGLAVLVKSWRHQQQLGLDFAVVMPSSEPARRIFDLAGFASVFEVTAARVQHRN